ncbi:hypothetical protein Tco_1337634 [Tanacetum coccineum]
MACQPSPEPPPVNGGQRQRSTVVNDGQPWRTTGQPPPDHRSTAVDRQSTVGSNGGHRCHVAAKWFRWRLRATVHPRLSVRGCQGGYELMISWYEERVSEPIIGNKCGGWSDEMTKMPPDLAL